MAAFLIQPIDGECCDDPCSKKDGPCDPCCPCETDSGRYVKIVYGLEERYADNGNQCVKTWAVCQSIEYFYDDDNCGYESQGPEFSPELGLWTIDGLLGGECETKGLGLYEEEKWFKTLGTTNIPSVRIMTSAAYDQSGDEIKVIEVGITDDTECTDNCSREVEFDCEGVEDPSGGTGLPLCSDPDLDKPCNDGPYPIDDGGDEPCCDGSLPICDQTSNGCAGSGVAGSGIQGSGCTPCCEETNDCSNIPPCCAKDSTTGNKLLPNCGEQSEPCCDDSPLPLCEDVANPCGQQGSGCQGSGVQGSGCQGSGPCDPCCDETNDCGECCDDPPDCECDNCYEGDPTIEYYCEEIITDDCDDLEFTKPVSSC